MKNVIFTLALGVLVFEAGSCVSMRDKDLSIVERQETDVIGSISTAFTSFQFMHIQSKAKLKNKAYEKLKQAAQTKYSGNIDVINIRINGSFSLGELAWIIIPWGLGTTEVLLGLEGGNSYLSTIGSAFYSLPTVFGNFQKITATGDVVLLDAGIGKSLSIQGKIQNLLPQMCLNLIDKLPKNSRVAVLSIASADQSLAENIIDDIELNLLESRKFVVIDRRQLDNIRKEQNFQLSGDVSDDSAVFIGHMLGASVVIVGNISTITSRGRISIRALDVETSEIIAMERERF
jgi:TolB-like protein